MNLVTRRKVKVQNAVTIASIFLFIIFGSVILLPFSSAFADDVAHQPIYNSFPIALNVPANADDVVHEPIYNSFPVALNVPAKPIHIAVTQVLPVKLAVTQVLPVKLAARLYIPSIKVNAVIRDMGVTSEGVMAIPGNRNDVGWYSDGTRPGETGSAVIGGHNRWENGDAVFFHLDKLKKGDVLSVTDAKGVSTSFIVREMRTYDAAEFDNGIFLSESGIHLNLITCSGDWDPTTQSYTHRLVIFTDIVPTH